MCEWVQRTMLWICLLFLGCNNYQRECKHYLVRQSGSRPSPAHFTCTSHALHAHVVGTTRALHAHVECTSTGTSRALHMHSRALHCSPDDTAQGNTEKKQTIISMVLNSPFKDHHFSRSVGLTLSTGR